MLLLVRAPSPPCKRGSCARRAPVVPGETAVSEALLGDWGVMEGLSPQRGGLSQPNPLNYHPQRVWTLTLRGLDHVNYPNLASRGGVITPVLRDYSLGTMLPYL